MRPSGWLGEAAAIALGSLRANKLRSFLTLLGIILATATLIAVMSVIEGMDRYIAGRITTDLGAGSFQIARMVRVGQHDPKTWIEMWRRNPELKREEFAFLREQAGLIREIGMEASRGVSVDREGRRLDNVGLRGAQQPDPCGGML
jgi:putative ABC transport system permease protein